MSSRYIQRLRVIRGEFEAARQGIGFVNQNWQKYSIYLDVDGVTPANFQRAAEYVFATYLIRLSAEFEGILKSHLALNHPGVPVQKDAKVAWLISRVSKAEGFSVKATLQANLEKVRKYRNDFAHSGQLPLSTFTFDSALSWFNTFLAKLPEPRR